MAITIENNVSAESLLPSKGKKSAVWEHFTLEKSGAAGLITRARCKQCKGSFAYRNGSKVMGTSHLKRHIAQGTCLRRRGEESSQNNPSKKRRRGSLFQAASVHQDNWMMGWIGADSQMLPVSSMSSPTPAPVSHCEANAVSIEEPEHFLSSEPNTFSIDELEYILSSEPNTRPFCPILLVQESVTKEKENCIPVDSAKGSGGKIVNVGNMSSYCTVKTETTESLEVGQLVEKPLQATMKTSSANCPTPSTVADVIPSPILSTSFSVQGRVEGFEFVNNFRIPTEYAVLYNKIHEVYGHMATRKVTFGDVFVANLLKIISGMETKRGVELNKELLAEWEKFIKHAEAVEFNIKWLREEFNQIMNHWRSSLGLEEEIHSHEEVLSEMFAKYDGLCTKKDELEAQLSEVKIQIKQTSDKILSEQ